MSDADRKQPIERTFLALLAHPQGWGLPIAPLPPRSEPSRMQEEIDQWLLDIGAISKV